MRKDKTVRITERAHFLLVEKAARFNVSQKEIASEAIMVLVQNRERGKNIQRTGEDLNSLLKRVQKLKRNHHLYTFATFVLGMVAGYFLSVAVGVMI